ncbi:nucleoporin Ndc1-like [Lutzomyia longipalpis]|uniref:nucleoporin Ndc1-like n=1 Tax=Lutzomyia longipalpis TaxID=7200 RepID=UPI0024836BA1|nr:nucleoporin Ndc1-like [Lutzomyia longipalpis]
MIAAQEVECRKICAERFFLAIACSTGSQFIMLGIFLLFVNFSIVHPVAWITGSIGKIFSFYTWLCIIPLIGSVGIYGMLMARHLATEPRYFHNRFSMYRSNGRMVAYLGAHGIVGFLTAWLYTKFLPDGYNSIVRGCNGDWCYNDKYIFMLLSGFYTGCYYFVKEIKSSNAVLFPIAQQGKYYQITSNLSGIFCKSLTMTIFSTASFIFSYWMGSLVLRWTIGGVFSLNHGGESLFGNLFAFLLDWKLLIFVWIVSSQILSNMFLITRFFHVFLTEYRAFPIVRIIGSSNEQEITLAEALACHKVPVIQDLACQDLFVVANGGDVARRRDIFTLSIPGGHPNNWKAIVSQSLQLITEFTQKLTKSLEGCQRAPILPARVAFVRPTATEMADKILWTQYTEGLRIRRGNYPQDIFPTPPDSTTSAKFYTLQDFRKMLSDYIASGKRYLMTYPGIHFLFSETPFEEVFFHLKHSQRIIWIIQAIAALTEKSIEEDKFGVVQTDLTDIIRTFLQLKGVLDKIGNLMLGERRIDRNFLALKSASRRSLYRISNTFSPYFGDLLLSDSDLRQLSLFVTYKEA